MLLVEKLPKLNGNNNIKNYLELDIKENNISSESDSDDDILFAYERYSLKDFKNEILLQRVMKLMIVKKNLHLNIIIIIKFMANINKYFIQLY